MHIGRDSPTSCEYYSICTVLQVVLFLWIGNALQHACSEWASCIPGNNRSCISTHIRTRLANSIRYARSPRASDGLARFRFSGGSSFASILRMKRSPRPRSMNESAPFFFLLPPALRTKRSSCLRFASSTLLACVLQAKRSFIEGIGTCGRGAGFRSVLNARCVEESKAGRRKAFVRLRRLACPMPRKRGGEAKGRGVESRGAGSSETPNSISRRIPRCAGFRFGAIAVAKRRKSCGKEPGRAADERKIGVERPASRKPGSSRWRAVSRIANGGEPGASN